MAFFGHLASFFTFAALVLQVFSLIGNTYNRAFLRSLYFVKLNLSNQFITFGLWYEKSNVYKKKSHLPSCLGPIVPDPDLLLTLVLKQYLHLTGVNTSEICLQEIHN